MQRIAASPHLLFMCVLDPLFFRSSSLYQLVLTRSRCPQLPKANHFLAYLALLAGPEALSHPVSAQNSQGRGRSWLGYAYPAKPKKKLRLRRKIEGNRSPRRTALEIPQKVPCPNSLPLCPPPDMAVVDQGGDFGGRAAPVPTRGAWGASSIRNSST
jgi:hypothetical protein